MVQTVSLDLAIVLLTYIVYTNLTRFLLSTGKTNTSGILPVYEQNDTPERSHNFMDFIAI